MSFQEWLEYSFNRPVPQERAEAWYWLEDDYEIDDRSRTIYVIELFENPSVLIDRYSEPQIAQGLWYICSAACSNHMCEFSCSATPSEVRKQAVLSLLNLYKYLFVPLTDKDGFDNGTRHCNTVCFMLWDIDSLWPPKEEPAKSDFWKDASYVLERAIRLPSVTVQMSALHGLGHLRSAYTQDSIDIIQQFLLSESVTNEVREYAYEAMYGHV